MMQGGFDCVPDIGRRTPLTFAISDTEFASNLVEADAFSSWLQGDSSRTKT
jgi:hypothetical protein